MIVDASSHIVNSVTIVGGLLAIIAVVAAAVGVARVSVFKAQVEGLRSDRDDLITRVKLVEDELAIEKASRISAEARVKVLEDVVTGREELASITSLLQAHDRKAERKADEILTAIGEKAS